MRMRAPTLWHEGAVLEAMEGGVPTKAVATAFPAAHGPGGCGGSGDKGISTFSCDEDAAQGSDVCFCSSGSCSDEERVQRVTPPGWQLRSVELAQSGALLLERPQTGRLGEREGKVGQSRLPM